MTALPDPSAVAQHLLAALDGAGAALQALSVQASRVAAFQVMSRAERTAERLPWLRARAAALHHRQRTPGSPAAGGEGEAWARLSGAAEALAAACAGADRAVDGADEAALGDPALRLQRVAEALDDVEEWLARLETPGPRS
ncbi:MAG TPA: hypothetical protein VFO85_17515 [Vicinamibacteria bacterium]|nr:hypothetical protein [Vicinamibacteria bacterium]